MGSVMPSRGSSSPARLLTVRRKKSRYLNEHRASRLQTTAPAIASFRPRLDMSHKPKR